VPQQVRQPRNVDGDAARFVERTFAWISRNRRLARDFERYATTVAAFIRLAMIRIMLRRLTRSTPCPGIPNFLDRLASVHALGRC
jgi:hypothetical protein